MPSWLTSCCSCDLAEDQGLEGSNFWQKKSRKQRLVAGEQTISEWDSWGCSDLSIAVARGHTFLPAVNSLLTGKECQNVWNMRERRGAKPAELASLFKVLLLHGDPPVVFIARLSRQQAKLVWRGRQLRALIPRYMEQQMSSIAARCPLPATLQSLVAAYVEPTPKDIWTGGLQ
jgi:hypothetical protein